MRPWPAMAIMGIGVIWNGNLLVTRVIPAKAGIHFTMGNRPPPEWVPTFAGMTAPGSVRIAPMTPLPQGGHALATRYPGRIGRE